jgi:hypothetical protein
MQLGKRWMEVHSPDAESDKRAYYGMISAMILAEYGRDNSLSEAWGREIANSHRHPTNRPNANEARARLLSVWRDRLAGCRVDAAVHSQIMGVRSLVPGPTDGSTGNANAQRSVKASADVQTSRKGIIGSTYEACERSTPSSVSGFQPSWERTSFQYPERSRFLLINSSLRLHAISCRRTTEFTSNFVDRLCKKRVVLKGKWCDRQSLIALSSELMQIFCRLQIQHKLYFAYVKHLWSMDQRENAIRRLERLCDIVDIVAYCESRQIGRSA